MNEGVTMKSGDNMMCTNDNNVYKILKEHECFSMTWNVVSQLSPFTRVPSKPRFSCYKTPMLYNG